MNGNGIKNHTHPNNLMADLDNAVQRQEARQGAQQDIQADPMNERAAITLINAPLVESLMAMPGAEEKPMPEKCKGCATLPICVLDSIFKSRQR